MSLFPCCKALWENDGNYVVSLTAFIISSVFELEFFFSCFAFHIAHSLWPILSHSMGILAFSFLYNLNDLLNVRNVLITIYNLL